MKQIDPEIYGESVLSIATKIYDYVLEGREKIEYISHGILRNRLGNQYTDEEIILTARLLTMLETPLLEEKYEFVSTTAAFAVSRAEINESKKDGYLVNPETGEEIENFADFIRVFYVPDQSFLAELSRGNNG